MCSDRAANAAVPSTPGYWSRLRHWRATPVHAAGGRSGRIELKLGRASSSPGGLHRTCQTDVVVDAVFAAYGGRQPRVTRAAWRWFAISWLRGRSPCTSGGCPTLPSSRNVPGPHRRGSLWATCIANSIVKSRPLSQTIGRPSPKPGGAAVTRRRDAIEAFEEPRQMLRRDPRAAIDHGDPHP
jgi:hypothetical protein